MSAYWNSKPYDGMTDLLRCRDELDHLLQSASAVLIEGNGHQRWSSVTHKGVALLIVAELE